MSSLTNSATELPSHARAGMLARCAFCASRHAHGAAVRAWRRAAVLGDADAWPARLARCRCATLDAAIGFQDGAWMARAVRGPQDMPDMTAWGTQTPSTWILPVPKVFTEAAADSYVMVGVTLVDLAGNQAGSDPPPVFRTPR